MVGGLPRPVAEEHDFQPPFQPLKELWSLSLNIAEGVPKSPLGMTTTSLSFLCMTPSLSTINGFDIFQDMDVLSLMPAAGKEERQQIDRSSTL